MEIHGHLTDPRLPQVAWAFCVGVTISAGAFGSALLAKLVPLTDDQMSILRLSVGWALASASGWYVSVSVGGAFSGVITALVILSIHRDNSIRFLIVGGAGLFAARIGLELPGTDNLVAGAAACGLFAAAAVAVATRMTGGTMDRIGASSMIIVAWAFAWAIAYIGKNAVGMPDLRGYGTNSLELVLAFAIGGAFTPTPNSAVSRALSWGAGGLLAAIIGMLLDFAISALHGGPDSGVLDGSPAFLDIGQSIGMGVGAAAAFAWLRKTSSPVVQSTHPEV